MKRISLALVALLALVPVSTASAQLLAAKDGPIVYGHHHLNTTNTEAARKFWIDALGGVLVKFGTNNTEIIKFPNALLFMRAANMPVPSGGSKGTTVDHIAFSVQNLRQTVDRVKAGGFRVVTAAEAPPNVKVENDIGVVTGGPVSGIAYVMAPDDMKVELLEVKAQAAPVASHHVHFAGMNKEMQAWYMQTFGAKEAPSANPAAFVSATLPGVLLNFTPAASVVGTDGRVIDHIGFEVKGLEAFLKQLEAKGTKPTVTYRKIEALGIAIAFVTDPWGTRIELTEGLDKVN
ncbi:MAG TPA: VOC family protein [Vicinamibacterales bacterium]|jgi:catechol 2,3-dioxygenase-like lactoylglutathione lyase family enzyme|nr:VOC family protein [Vicinamibacterales bacterium]